MIASVEVRNTEILLSQDHEYKIINIKLSV